MEVNHEIDRMDVEEHEFEFTLSELIELPSAIQISSPSWETSVEIFSCFGDLWGPWHLCLSWIINAFLKKSMTIIEMESIFKEMSENFISQSFCQELAIKFSRSVYRSEKFPVKWEQVRSWFQDKQSSLAAEAIPSFSPEETLASPRALPFKRRDQVSTISINEAAGELPNLMFEARSAKDYAWFDVAYFLNFRVLNSGELMVRVRFAGFDREEDEWVSADKAIRERSIPLDPTECNAVNAGDPVLCYRVNEYHALYVDAVVTGIERRSHDESSCTCVFTVCYDYDNVEGKVGCNDLCRRPMLSSSKESKALGFSLVS